MEARVLAVDDETEIYTLQSYSTTNFPFHFYHYIYFDIYIYYLSLGPMEQSSRVLTARLVYCLADTMW